MEMGAGPQAGRPVLARAPSMSMDMLQSQDLGVYNSEQHHPDLMDVEILIACRELLCSRLDGRNE